LQRAVGKIKVASPPSVNKPEVEAAVKPMVEGKLTDILLERTRQSGTEFQDTTKRVIESLSDSVDKADISATFDALVKSELRANVLNNSRRAASQFYPDTTYNL